MKKCIKIFSFLLIIGVLVGSSSCATYRRADNGNHKGWFKNTHNPHHPSSNNPGHTKAKVKMQKEHKKNK